VYKWRQQLDDFGTANTEKKLMSRGMKMLFGSATLYNTATAISPIMNILPKWLVENGLNPWAEGHEMMKFPKKPFHEQIKELEK
jgi:L-lactate dehydrogenase complex protein LldF